MPRSAIATGAVDFVVPVAEMPARLLDYAHHPYLKRSGVPSPATESADHLSAILTLIRTRTRRNFHPYKKTTLRRRIERRMGLQHITSLDAYLALLARMPRRWPSSPRICSSASPASSANRRPGKRWPTTSSNRC